ncbi:MAG: RNA-binding protein [Victivallales bacterium]|nr:RNA-binding protein [Victivallales bacterium]
MNIYVGNIAFSASDEELRELFEKHGDVTTAKIIKDRETGRSKGFGFVEMDNGGEEAIENLNGFEMLGRRLKVNKARPKGDRPQNKRRF